MKADSGESAGTSASAVARPETALDCATGNGQAAIDLAGRFDEVVAFDLSAQQVAKAAPEPEREEPPKQDEPPPELDEPAPPLDLRASPLLIPLAHTLVAFPFVVCSLAPALRSNARR